MLPWLFLSLLPYALVVAMPSWRWLLGASLLLGGPLTLLWFDHWRATQSPTYNEGPAGFIGIALFGVITIGVVWGIVIRAAELTLQAMGWLRHRSLAFDTAGFLLLIGAAAAIQGWEAWRLRPPSEACRQTSFDVDLSGLRFSLPAAAPVFNVYTERSSTRGAYYFALPTSLRDLCARTATGRDPIRATRLHISFEARQGRPGLTCDNPPAWGRALCASMPDGPHGGFPVHASVYAAGEVSLGEFLGSASIYDDSLAPRAGARETYIQTRTLTPDRKPLTFACSDSGATMWCRAGYPWQNGAHLGYAFRAPKDAVAQRGEEMDKIVRAFLAPLLR